MHSLCAPTATLVLLMGGLGAPHQGSGPPEDPAPNRSEQGIPSPAELPGTSTAETVASTPAPAADAGVDRNPDGATDPEEQIPTPEGAGEPRDVEAGPEGASDNPVSAEGAGVAPAGSIDDAVRAFQDKLAADVAAWRAQGAPRGSHPLSAALPRADALVAAGWADGRLWILERADRLLRDPSERSRRRSALISALFAEPAEPAQVERRALALAAAARDLAGPKDEDGPRYAGYARALVAQATNRSATAAALTALGAVLVRTTGGADRTATAGAEAILELVRTAYVDTAAPPLAAAALFDLVERDHGRALEAHWRGAADGSDAPDPTRAAWPRVVELAHAGVGPARWWLVVHANAAIDDPDERRRLRLKWLGELVEHHASEPWLAEVVRIADSLSADLGPEVVRELGERLLAASEDPEVRAWTQHSLALSWARDRADPAARARAENLLEALRNEQPEHRLARGVDALLFELRHLRPGSVPPDFVSRDVDGREVRLSHTRGLVTALLFWGTWSPPSVDAAKELARLEQRFADGPFTVLGVVTDSDREAWARMREQIGARWIDAWQESPGGPWPAAWGVRDFPTLFLFDAEGRLVQRNVFGEALFQAVEKLVRNVRPGYRARPLDDVR